MSNEKKIAAVIVAAGKGLRMGGNVPKQYIILNGKPILRRTVEAFIESRVQYIYVVCPAGDEEYVRSNVLGGLEEYITGIVPGGCERFDSCRIGIENVTKEADYILIHDGVRSLVRADFINSIIDTLSQHRACCPGVPPKDTVRRIGESGNAIETLKRSELMLIQTPQGFEAELIRKAYKLFACDTQRDQIAENITDDAMLVSYYTNEPIYITEGSYENIKITTPEDLLYAEAILRR